MAEEYTFIDILQPWLVLTVILVPIVYAERWIHQHFFGIGYLISKDKMSATRLFYVFFLPGIVVHEFIQYLVAGALNVPLKKVVAWPEQQENGTLRLDFIVVEQKDTDWLRAALVAASPFLVMAGMVWYISTHVLDMHDFTSSLGTGDIRLMWEEFKALWQTSDFVLWVYLLFVVANSMVPKREDARGWPVILGIGGALALGMAFIGLDEVLIETLAGPIAEAMGLVNSALLTILVLDVLGILFLGIVEDTLEYFRGFKMDYSPGESLTKSTRRRKREPGSDEPLAKGESIPTIYNIELPLPDPSKLPKPRRAPVPQPEPAPAASLQVRETTPQELVRPERPAAEPARPSAIPHRPSILERTAQEDAAQPASEEVSAIPSRPSILERAEQEDKMAGDAPPARPSRFQRGTQDEVADSTDARPSHFQRGTQDEAVERTSPFGHRLGSSDAEDAEKKPARPTGLGARLGSQRQPQRPASHPDFRTSRFPDRTDDKETDDDEVQLVPFDDVNPDDDDDIFN